MLDHSLYYDSRQEEGWGWDDSSRLLLKGIWNDWEIETERFKVPFLGSNHVRNVIAVNILVPTFWLLFSEIYINTLHWGIWMYVSSGLFFSKKVSLSISIPKHQMSSSMRITVGFNWHTIFFISRIWIVKDICIWGIIGFVIGLDYGNKLVSNTLNRMLSKISLALWMEE